MPKPPERYVPQSEIHRIFNNEQPKGEDVPTIDGNAPEAGGASIGTMTLKEILDLLKTDRQPKRAVTTQLVTEVEGKLFSGSELHLPRKGQPLLVIEDERKGRQVLVIKEDQPGFGKRNVRKLPAWADPSELPHISVEAALLLFDKESVHGGLPMEETLQKIARLTHTVPTWKSKHRSLQGGWSSEKERKRVKKYNSR